MLINVFAFANDEPKEFLKTYGWSGTYVSEFKTKIPEKFVHEPGDYPINLYWALNNELSKKIKLDMKKYKGKEVTFKIYSLEEKLPYLHFK